MKRAKETVFGRTPQGQVTYDVLMSSLSAKECVRRWPGLSREFVLKMRRENPDMRPGGSMRLKKRRAVR